MNRELLKGSLELMVLHILSEESDYGYSIVRKLKQKSGKIFQSGEGTLYPHLYTLEKKDFIRGKWILMENGRKRKYYSLTTKGESHLKKQKIQWLKLVSLVTSIIEDESYVLKYELSLS
jgi:DNA-binding PadR family transcriptional regulator